MSLQSPTSISVGETTLLQQGLISQATTIQHSHSLICDPLSVFQAPIMFDTDEFIQTVSGNKVATKSVLAGSHKIHIAGKVSKNIMSIQIFDFLFAMVLLQSIIHPGVVLRGDLASLRIGKFVSIGKGTTLRPAFKPGKK